MLPAPIMAPRSVLSATGAILATLSEREIEQIYDRYVRSGDVAQRPQRVTVAGENQPPASRDVTDVQQLRHPHVRECSCQRSGDADGRSFDRRRPSRELRVRFRSVDVAEPDGEPPVDLVKTVQAIQE